VDRGVKKIQFTGHYKIVVFFNLITYLWLIVALNITSPNHIEIWEALFTLALYIPLLTITYGYDKLREKRAQRRLAAIPDDTGEN
jgi:uncharacterized protein involved in response to NO